MAKLNRELDPATFRPPGELRGAVLLVSDKGAPLLTAFDHALRRNGYTPVHVPSGDEVSTQYAASIAKRLSRRFGDAVYGVGYGTGGRVALELTEAGHTAYPVLINTRVNNDELPSRGATAIFGLEDEVGLQYEGFVGDIFTGESTWPFHSRFFRSVPLLPQEGKPVVTHHNIVHDPRVAEEVVYSLDLFKTA